MAWTEKGTPTPFDTQPISGLLFLDGDLIAKTQQPDLPRNWAESFQGLKYPIVIFPSGTEASVTAGEESEILVCIQRQMRLPYFATREMGYERATTLAEEHQAVERVGETGLALTLDAPDGRVLITYNNEAEHISDIAFMDDASGDAEQLLAIKDEITDRFGRLPPEHQATLGLVLVKTVLDGEWGAWFKDTILTRLGIDDATHIAPYVFQVTREQLRQVHFPEEKIAHLSDADLTTIASLIHEHYITDAFWDELVFITDLVLAGKKRSL